MVSCYVVFDVMMCNDSVVGWKFEVQFVEEVCCCFFSNSDVLIKIDDVVGNFDVYCNLFWVDFNNNLFIENFQNDVQVLYGNGYGSIYVDGFKVILDGVLMVLVGELGLCFCGVYIVNVMVRFVNLFVGFKVYEFFD